MPYRLFTMGLATTKSAILVTLMVWASSSVAQTAFTNVGSIANTRHNLSQSTLSASIRNTMDLARNDYGEVCVYCHTPHAANTTIAAPLWNRTIKTTTYSTYNSSTLTQPVSQPGPNSLSCLSCHDGTVAIDSIINMPGSNKYNAAQQTSQNTTFLNTWNNPAGRVDTVSHMGLNSKNGTVGNGVGSIGCLVCHSSDPSAAIGGATDFVVANLGTDLTNDHPVGIRYPAMGPGVDFKPTTGVKSNIAFFDTNTNGRLDKSDIRLYDTGGGFAVECASCHDPHGVPSAGPGSIFNKTFMRVSNDGSALCLTCHVK